MYGLLAAPLLAIKTTCRRPIVIAPQGVPQNYAEAMKWYRKAVGMGSSDAAYDIALMYYWGSGVPIDHVQEAAWYRIGAELGNKPAMGQLGVMYRDGDGVPQSYVQAYLWFDLETAADPSSRRSRDEVATHLTPSQLTEAQKLAADWMAAYPRALQ